MICTWVCFIKFNNLYTLFKVKIYALYRFAKICTFLPADDLDIFCVFFSESRHLLKRESSQNVSITEQGLNCMTTVLDCPKTPSDVVTLGDPSEGQQLFRQNFFTDLCRYFFFMIILWCCCLVRMTDRPIIN